MWPLNEHVLVRRGVPGGYRVLPASGEAALYDEGTQTAGDDFAELAARNAPARPKPAPMPPPRVDDMPPGSAICVYWKPKKGNQTPARWYPGVVLQVDDVGNGRLHHLVKYDGEDEPQRHDLGALGTLSWVRGRMPPSRGEAGGDDSAPANATGGASGSVVGGSGGASSTALSPHSSAMTASQAIPTPLRLRFVLSITAAVCEKAATASGSMYSRCSSCLLLSLTHV